MDKTKWVRVRQWFNVVPRYSDYPDISPTKLLRLPQFAREMGLPYPQKMGWTYHTRDCIKRQEAYDKLLKEFKEGWPDFCQKCNGWGIIEGPPDMVPYGSTWVPLPGTGHDSCPDCLEQYKCPRCGREQPDEHCYDNWSDDCVCFYCGWRELDNDYHGAPEPPECYCYELRTNDMIRELERCQYTRENRGRGYGEPIR